MRRLLFVPILMCLLAGVSCQKAVNKLEGEAVKSDVSMVTDEMVDSLMREKYGIERCYLTESELSALSVERGKNTLVAAYRSTATKKLYVFAIPADFESDVPVHIYDQKEGEPRFLRTVRYEKHGGDLSSASCRLGRSAASSEEDESLGFFKRKKDESFSDCYDRLSDDFCDSLIARIAYETHVSIRIMIAVMCAEEESSSDNQEEGK